MIPYLYLKSGSQNYITTYYQNKNIHYNSDYSVLLWQFWQYNIPILLGPKTLPISTKCFINRNSKSKWK